MSDRRHGRAALALALALAWASAHAQAQLAHPTDYLKQIDRDGDGRVSAEEYVAWMRYGFDAMDRNGDGTVNINEAFGATFASIDAPMGGMRQSGMGRRQGAEGIHRYTETQSVAQQKLTRFGPLFGMSDQTYNKITTATFSVTNKLERACAWPRISTETSASSARAWAARSARCG